MPRLALKRLAQTAQLVVWLVPAFLPLHQTVTTLSSGPSLILDELKSSVVRLPSILPYLLGRAALSMSHQRQQRKR